MSKSPLLSLSENKKIYKETFSHVDGKGQFFGLGINQSYFFGILKDSLRVEIIFTEYILSFVVLH